MNARAVLLLKAVVSIVLAIFMLFFAVPFVNWFLNTPVVVEQIPEPLQPLVGLARLGFAFFGAMLIGVGLISYFASGAAASPLRRRILLSLALADVVGFVVQLLAQLSGRFNGLGWILVVIWIVLVVLLLFAWMRAEA